MAQPILFALRRWALGGAPSPFMPGPFQGALDPILIPRWYIDPSLGTGLNNGSSWPNAFNNPATAWADAIAASSAGDDFYVNAASNCSNAGSQILTFKGTVGAPNRIFSCTGITNNPPQLADLGAGAQFTVTGNNLLTVRGYLYAYGIVFNGGSGGAGAIGINLGNTLSEQVYDSCAMKLLSTGASNIGISSNNGLASKITFINTPITINGTTITSVLFNDGIFIWRDTPNAVQGTQNAIANLLIPISGCSGLILCDGVDFAGTTGIGSGKNIVGAHNASYAIQFVDCKTISGVLMGRPTGPQATIDQIVTDSGATNYKQQRDMYQGTLTADTTRYNNASDGVTPISWQVITTANAKPQSPFECFAISKKVAAGTYAASKIFITSSVPLLKTNDVWVEVKYLGASYALSSPATSFAAGSGSATLSQLPQGSKPGTLQTASPSWATGSLGYDYQLAIPSFTTAVAGEVAFFVKVGRASLTVNIDPNAMVA